MPNLLAPIKIGPILISPKHVKKSISDPASAREEAASEYYKKRAAEAHKEAEKAETIAETAYDDYISAQMASKLKPSKRNEAKAEHAARKVGDKDEEAYLANQRANYKFTRAHPLADPSRSEQGSLFDEQA